MCIRVYLMVSFLCSTCVICLTEEICTTYYMHMGLILN
uniref:Uncharacterized protein n=1 Tax=Rhizophora mucronata TaxID=61149 RepID=A0A2P2QUR4_RHIMU